MCEVEECEHNLRCFSEVFYLYKIKRKENRNIESSFDFKELPCYRKKFMIFISLWGIICALLIAIYDISMGVPLIIFVLSAVIFKIWDGKPTSMRTMKALLVRRERERIEFSVCVLKEANVDYTDKSYLEFLIDEAQKIQKDNNFVEFFANYRSALLVMFVALFDVIAQELIKVNWNVNVILILGLLAITFVTVKYLWEFIVSLFLEIFSDYFVLDDFIKDMRRVMFSGTCKI